jgi:hypothetical protein
VAGLLVAELLVHPVAVVMVPSGVVVVVPAVESLVN